MSRPDRWVFGTSTALILAGALLIGAALRLAGEEPAKTREEQLLEQTATLQMQLAQALAAWHACEASGPAAVQLQREGQETAQTVLKSLATRGLTLDKDGRLVPLPVVQQEQK